MTQICTKCKVEKPVDEFRWRNKKKGWRAPWCKSCFSAHEKEKWPDRKSKVRPQRRERYKRNAQFVYDYLSTHPCVDCGEDDPLVLEFDHKKDKEHNVADLRRTLCSLERIKKEIDKCEVRCANCHRRKTAKQFGWYKNLTIGDGV